MDTKSAIFTLDTTFSRSEIDATYNRVIATAAANYETKGFRKGKVPLSVVKEHLSQSAIIEEILTSLITKFYSQKVEEKHLHPIIQPQIKVQNPPLTLDKEWQINITGCELPLVKLSPDYQSDIKKINTTVKDDNNRLNLTLTSLIKNATVDLPEMLVKNDVDNKMSQLIDQTEQAGITVNTYLKSKNTTLEKYQKDLQTQIQQEWITNLCIDHIAKTNNITVSEKDADEVISKNKDLAKNLNLVYYLLTQQKVFEFLKNLS